MKMKMKRVSVVLLFFVLLGVMWCEGCWKEEREALLGLNSRFGFPLSWEWDGTNCCQWDRVECNSSTGRVAKLNLNNLQISSNDNFLNYSDFFVFKDLKSLNLSNNNYVKVGCAHNEGLENLEVLDLSHNGTDMYNVANVLSCLDRFSSLKSLYLRWNQLDETTFNVFETLSSKLRNLEVLDISDNHLTNDILPSLGGFTSLKELYLSSNELNSDLHIQGFCSKLKNLEVLDLSDNSFSDSDIASALSGISSLKSLKLGSCRLTPRSIFSISKLRSLEILDLADNQLNESILWRQDFHNLSNLEHLALDDNYNLGNEFLKSIGELISLKVLSLSNCGLNGTLSVADWSKLKKLEELNLSNNKFEGQLPSSFVDMTSLRILELSQNHFTGQLDSTLASLTSLEYFEFGGNQFEVPISFTPFANHSNLKFIYGEGNKVVPDSQPSLQTWIPKFQLQVLSLSSTTESDSLQLPNFLFYQNNLTILDFTSCRLEGEFPHWLLENNTNMNELLVRNCSFTGAFHLPSRPLPNMRKIDVSDNIINSQFPSNNISSIYPNLQHLDLSRNNIQGTIPRELGQINSLDTLDLSNNQLSGEIPKDIFGVGHQLQFLKLSNNKLEGPIFTIPNYLQSLLLNDNSLSGTLPISIFNTCIISLDIRNNHLVGKIPSLIKNLSGLMELSMSNNHFEGAIPLELAELESLIYLDLSQNNLIGLVPSFINSSLRIIHLNNNHLSGLSKRMFNGNDMLVMLDLSYNEITNSIKDLIQGFSYSGLNFLLLKGNHFTGDIPKQLCHLRYLNILDLSHNYFTGAIPNCLGKMPFKNNPEKLLKLFDGFVDLVPFPLANVEPHILPSLSEPIKQLPNVQEKANFTSKKRIDTYTGSILAYMSGIDLSHNKLKGNIPSELGNLKTIRALNLSHNDLLGQIPATFSNLIQTESLDLSFNKLSGRIPSQLSSLTSLEVFSVAHNNLSDATPEWKGQFSTFDESSYEGNPFLCGPPLPKSCNPPPTIIPNDAYNKDNSSLVDMYVFCVSFAVSYAIALLATAVALYINPYWRRAWFYYMEFVSSSCYYFIVDSLHRFSNSRNM